MRNKDEHKELVIRQEAIRMIVQEGFDGLSMHKLAKQAAISASTIYVYFNSREDLLHQLYLETQDKFETDALVNFSVELSLAEGLWLQWTNRLTNITRDPLSFQFYEQFRNSPLISKVELTRFRKTMQDFVQQCVQRKELKDLPDEIFWALAYGPFYALVKFHLDRSTMVGKPFLLTEQTLRLAFDLVLTALSY